MRVIAEKEPMNFFFLILSIQLIFSAQARPGCEGLDELIEFYLKDIKFEENPGRIYGSPERLDLVYASSIRKSVDEIPEGFAWNATPDKLKIRKVSFESTIIQDPIDSEKRLAKVIGNAKNVGQNSLFIGQGGFNRAYLVFEKAMPKNLKSQKERISWILKNNKDTYVVRLMQDQASARQFAEREFAMLDLVDKTSQNVSFKGKKLVRSVRDYSTTDDILAGRTRREFVSGPSAFELRAAVDDVLGIGPGFTENPSQIIKRAGFSNAQEAKNYISALEAYYKKLDATAIKFSRSQKWAKLKNIVGASSHEVGLDYNHGRNAIWNSKEKIWVIIDA